LPTLLGIHGSVTQPGRLNQALQLALQSIGNQGNHVTTSLLHLGDHRISFADGRPLSDYPDDTEAVVQRVMAADMYLIATPIFRASFTGSLKNLLDLVPVEGLMGKACGLIAMGASEHHYLAVDSQLRPVLAWFGAHLVPGAVYLQSRQFQDGQLADSEAIAGLESLANAVIAMQQAAAQHDGITGPPPLAAR
jgi:FMN reductase